MVPYRYIKAPPGKGNFFIKKKVFLGKAKKISPPIFITLGVIALILVIEPILAYKWLTFNKLNGNLLFFISHPQTKNTKAFLNPSVAGTSTQETELDTKELDYNFINNWFPTAPILPVKPSRITHYKLSIPKLKISEAIVEIGGVEIKKSLLQYPGTALPGEYGNIIIFGHSVLPIFYNPKDYKTIFSLLPTLKKGDKILVNFDGIEYTYAVTEYKEVKAEEIDVLEQRNDQQTLSLITCVPPGTYLRRGVIKSRLVKNI